MPVLTATVFLVFLPAPEVMVCVVFPNVLRTVVRGPVFVARTVICVLGFFAIILFLV